MGSTPNISSSRLAHLTCPTSVVNSSESNSWDGLLLEHHRIPQGERVETATDRHVLWLWTTSYSGEYAGNGGRFVRCSKGRGAITATPIGVIPTLHTYTRSEVILCALDSNFVGSILSELDRQPRTEPIIRPKFQDSAIRRLMTILSEEVRAGGTSGKLYSDSLAPALAIRYLLLGERPRHQKTDSTVSALPPYALKRVLASIEHTFHSDITIATPPHEPPHTRA